MKLATVNGALSGNSWHTRFPAVVWNVAVNTVGCGSFAAAGAAVAVFATDFAAVDEVVVLVCANTTAESRKIRIILLIFAPGMML